MKIDPNDKLQVSQSSRLINEQNSQPGAAAPAGKDKSPAAAANGQLSVLSKSLENSYQSLRAQEDVDTARVQRVKMALESGELLLDDALLAEAMLGMHKR